MTTANINGDGKPDIIVANYGSDTVSVMMNTTAPGAAVPTFASQQTFATGNGPFSVTLADVNGDGLPDIIVANAGSDTVSVLLNTTAPGAAAASFATQRTFATASGPVSVTTSDLNGSGLADLIVADEGANVVSVLMNTMAPGATTASFAAQRTFATGSAPRSVTAADVNGDGLPDIIVDDYGSSSVAVLLNTTVPGAALPTFAAQQEFATGSTPSSLVTADLNGDGRPDVIVANYGSGTVSVLLNTTAPGATTASFATQRTFATGNGPRSVAVVDLNGDGVPDLIVANYNSFDLSVLQNTTVPGSATATFAPQQTFLAGNGPFSVAAADLNGDGRADIIVANYTSDTVGVLLNTTSHVEASSVGVPTPVFTAVAPVDVNNAPSSVTVADINGDGKPDIILVNSVLDTVSVLLNTTAPGASFPSFAAPQTFQTGSFPLSVAVADLNGDGLPDLIVGNEVDGTVSVLMNTSAAGATTLSFATQVAFATGAESP